MGRGIPQIAYFGTLVSKMERNVLELRLAEVQLRGIHLPRTSVNKGKKEGRSYDARPFQLRLYGDLVPIGSDRARVLRDTSPRPHLAASASVIGDGLRFLDLTAGVG
jgi:hypothetical protein